jgi:hypothetical protein
MILNKKGQLLSVCLLLCFAATCSLAEERFVVPPVADREPGFDYSVYTNSYTSIQSAVDVANDEDHIVLLPGIFKLSSQVSVEGRALIIRSLSTGHKERTIVDGQGLSRTFFLKLTATIIRDLTLRNGLAPVLAGGDSYGGAVYIEDGGTVDNCIIENSTAVYGGGVRIYGTGEVLNSMVSRNTALTSGGGVQTAIGGVVSNCVIFANNAADKGGGVYCYEGGDIATSIIVGNTAYYGGGVRLYYSQYFQSRVSRCKIYSNTAIRRSTSPATGGGVQMVGGGSVENSVIYDNEADGRGGGVYIYQAGTLMNNTIAHNLTKDNNGDGVGDGTGGGVYTSGGGTLQNNIIMQNDSTIGPNYSGEGTSPVYRNNLSSPSIPGNNNISGLPRFMDEDGRDYRLQSISPCIDAGSTASGAPVLDHDGMIRPLDGTGNGLRANDIGAYEYFEIDDIDNDGMPTYWELLYDTFPFDLDPNDPLDAAEDMDSDGLLNLDEYLAGTDPTNSDSDGDGLLDGDEVSGFYFSPIYGVLFTDPATNDTDADGFIDSYEIFNQSNPTNALSFLTTVSGSTSYSGSFQTNGSVHVTIASPNMPSRSTVEAGLGAYTVGNVPTLLPLTVTAFRDGNNSNGTANVQDNWEPTGAYTNNPLSISGAVVNIDIVLDDATFDSDGDGLSDYEELYIYGTGYLDTDTDDDGMTDGWEVDNGLDPLDPTDDILDPDTDGLTNIEEFGLNTDPNDPDTDGDGMPDGWESLYPGALQPTVADDGDDFDNDGLTNLGEYQNGTDPTLYDTDNDVMPDGWEVYFAPALSPLTNDAAEGVSTIDFDELSNLDEFLFGLTRFGAGYHPTNGLNPTVFDTDGDAMADGYEARYYPSLDPLTADATDDFDLDGLTNFEEYNWPTNVFYPEGLDPTNPDTDGDGAADGLEASVGTDPLDAAFFPLDILGTVSYAGAQTGVFYVVASQVPTGSVYMTSMTNAGAYVISNAANAQSYTVTAFLDINGNATQDTWEARGAYVDTNDVPIVFTLTNLLTGIDVTVEDSTEDNDGDGLTDYDEVIIHGTDPNDTDTDNDSMPDGWEVDNGLDPLVDDALGDPDSDSLRNQDEYIHNGDPQNPDTDGEGLLDGAEVLTYGTEPDLADTDGDGLTDFEEVMTYGTDPLVADDDGDGFADGFEVLVGTDPLNPLSFPATVSGTISYVGSQTGIIYVAAVDTATNIYMTSIAVPGVYSLTNVPTLETYTISAYMDTSGDTLPDTWEAQGLYAGNPVALATNLTSADITLSHPATDTDGDGLSDFDEVNVHGSDPNLIDTDSDVMPDGWEVAFGLSPTNGTNGTIDSEPDGMTSLAEYQFSSNALGAVLFVPTNGLNPTVADTDGDGIPEGWEVYFGLDPLDVADGALDPDADGMTSAEEYAFSTNYFASVTFDPATGLSPTNSDTDADGFTDGQEVSVGSDPLDPNAYPFVVSGTITYGGTQTGVVWLVATSIDGVISNALTMVGTSVVYSVSNLVTSTDYAISAYRDSTGNGILDTWEASGTHPVVPVNSPSNALSGIDVVLTDPVVDTDGDLLTDYDEVYVHHTDPLNPDSDADLMPDGWEAYFGLNPTSATNMVIDVEPDGMTSLEEYQYSSNVLGSAIFAPTNGLNPTVVDTDGDGLPDGWEVYFGLDPLNVLDGALNPDGDGLTSLAEYQFTTNYLSALVFDPATGLYPTNADTDIDSMPDGWEATYYPVLDPLVADDIADPDLDGLINSAEYLNGTNPTNSDTDADSYLDGFEVQWQASPTNALSFPVSMTGTLLNNTLPVLTGTVYVALHYEQGTNLFNNFSIGDITAGGPHPFTVQYVPTLSNYWISAFMDLSGNGLYDTWEPYGVSAVTVTNGITPTNDFSAGLIPMGDSTADSDGDGLTDYDEVTIYGTNPNAADTDGDTFNDYDELFVYITDPLIAASFPASISGNVTYGGTQAGLLLTVADNGSTLYSNVFGAFAVGPYSTATNLPTLTNYTLTAYIDTNTNGVMDIWEARGSAIGNPYLLLGNVTGADIAIDDPSDDTDGDGLTNYEEYYVYGTDPTDPDTDVDGMWDGWEVYFSLNPTNGLDAANDGDTDGLLNLEEFQFSTNYFSTNFFNPATGLDPTVADTDGDELLDGVEVLVHLTDPLVADTDGDGMPDGWEVTFGLDPFVDDALLDTDSEGLSNLAEYEFSTNYFGTVDFGSTNGLNPTLADTDTDGLTDYEEIFDYGTDPLLADSDGDGFDDYDELINIGSDPQNLLDPVVVDDDAPADPVPNDPNNINYFSENGSIDFPYDAIQQAVDVAQPGFVVLVLDGEYKSTGNGNINPRGQAMTIRSRNGYAFTEILQDSGNGFIVTSGEASDTVIQGFTIRTSVADLGSAGVLVTGSSPVIRECYFYDCGEAGVYVRGGGQPLIEDCLFEQNQGAIKIQESHPRVERCIMRFNEDDFGGGLYIIGTSTVTSQPIIVNSLIATNRATNTGGGVYVGAYTRPIFVNTTIADNTADVRGGGIYNAGDTKFWNGILWGNNAPLGPGFSLDKAFETSYSCMQTPRPTSIQVITADPQFAGGGDYSLLSSSPCIDHGTGSIPYTGAGTPTNDINLNSRPVYVSSFPGYDAGAYEYQPGGGLFVQAPGGTAGQVLESGLPQTINWTYDGAVGTNLVLEYTYQFLTDPSLTWSLISSNVYRGNAGSGSFTWTVPVTNTTRCYVRVSDATNALVGGISTFSFSITNGIQVYAPTNGELYYLGQTVDVAWASSPSATTNVQWALTTDGINFDALNGAMLTNSVHVSGGVTNTGAWVLNPLNPGYLTTNGQVRVSGTGLRSGDSGSDLSILGLVVTIPAQGAEIQTGATRNVRWTSLGAGPSVDISYSDDGGVSFTPVTNGITNIDGTNLFVWTVPTTVTSNAVIEISSPSDTNIWGRTTFVISDTGGDSVSILGDGIPDQWRIDTGLDPENLDGQSGANDDPDGDGSSNQHEWLAGTSPLDGNSVFGIVSVSNPAGGGGDIGLDATGVVLRWRTVPGRQYVVEATDSPTGGWTAVSGLLLATGEEMEWTDSLPGARRFYRIGTLVE